MIVIHFGLASDVIQVTIDGSKVKFANTAYGAIESGIEGLKLYKPGVIKEFPELEHKANWKSLAAEKFNEKIKKMRTEDERMDYIISELQGQGYIAIKSQKNGFRPRRF